MPKYKKSQRRVQKIGYEMPFRRVKSKRVKTPYAGITATRHKVTTQPKEKRTLSQKKRAKIAYKDLKTFRW